MSWLSKIKNEYKDEEDTSEARTYMREKLRSASNIKSAVTTDHVAAKNHTINWVNAQIIDKEGHKTTVWLKVAIWIRHRGTNIVNKDEVSTN